MRFAVIGSFNGSASCLKFSYSTIVVAIQRRYYNDQVADPLIGVYVLLS